MARTTIDPDEIKKFEKIAAQWWDETGKFAPLHKIGPVRLDFIREHAIARFSLDEKAMRPFEGLRVLDIGCGGGLLCEPMARLGAKVVGVDAGETNVKTAMVHADQSGLAIDYRVTTAEALAEAGESFDLILNMEVVEHVADVPLFMKSCCAMVRPGGLMIVSTINRTARAWALAIVAAENVLRWLPRGTHQYEKLVTPGELTSAARRNGMEIIETAGMSFNPLANRWGRTRDTGVNYLMAMGKPG